MYRNLLTAEIPFFFFSSACINVFLEFIFDKYRGKNCSKNTPYTINLSSEVQKAL